MNSGMDAIQEKGAYTQSDVWMGETMGEVLSGWFPDIDDQLSDFALIPRLRAEASMGGGAECHSDDEIIGHLAFKNVWLQKKRLNPRFLALVDAIGDSMSPTICDGDLLLVDLRQKEPMDNRIFVIRMNQQLYAKRLQYRPGQKLVVHSDNPHTPEFDMDSVEYDGLDIVGRVVWAGKDL